MKLFYCSLFFLVVLLLACEKNNDDGAIETKRIVKIDRFDLSDFKNQSINLSLNADTVFSDPFFQIYQLEKVASKIYQNGVIEITLKANRGEYKSSENRFQLQGSVHLVKDNGDHLQTEALTIDLNKNTLYNDASVLTVIGGNEIIADGIFIDLETKRIRLKTADYEFE